MREGGQPLILSCPSHHPCRDLSSSVRCWEAIFALQIASSTAALSFVLCSKVSTDKTAGYLFARLIYGQNYPLICLGCELDQQIVLLNKQKTAGRNLRKKPEWNSLVYITTFQPLRLFLSLQYQESMRVAGPHRNIILTLLNNLPAFAKPSNIQF